MAKLTKERRSKIMKAAWKKRKPKAIDAYTGKPIFAGGIIYKGKPYHKVSLRAMLAGIPAKMVSNPETVKQWLQGLARSTRSTDMDSIKMQNLLHKIGFPKARVVLGIVYLEGKGTLDAPPTSIHSIAKMLVEKAGNPTDIINVLRKRRAPFRGRLQPRGPTAIAGAREFNPKRHLMVPEQHQLKIARETLRMPDAMVGVMGGMTKSQARKIIKELTGKTPKENPQYAFGPTGYRPPAAWWAKMMAQAKIGYRRIKGQSLESYNRALSRIVGGIWSKYTDATRMKILKKYEPSAVRATANVPRLRYLPCPVCGVTNSVGSANVYLRCKGCGRPLMSVRVRRR